MAQQRQSGMERIGVRGSHDLQTANGTADHVFIGVHGSTHKQPRHRRSARSDRTRKLMPGLIMVFLLLVLGVTVLAYYYLSIDELNKDNDDNDDLKSDSDFLTNVPRIERSRVLEFGHGSVGHGRDSRYWDRDDRRRDGDYNEDVVEQINRDENVDKDNASAKLNSDSRSSNANSHKGLKRRGVGLYNEAGRHELKMYEAAYEASLKNGVNLTEDDGKMPYDVNQEKSNAAIDVDDEYDDFSDSHDARMEDYGDNRNIAEKNSNILKANNEIREASLNSFDTRIKDDNVFDDAEGFSSNRKNSHFVKANSQQINQGDAPLMKKSHPETKKKRKRRKFSGSKIERCLFQQLKLYIQGAVQK